ncbi:hypothetical protein KKC91_12610 [bacterium]|nr:hypothetical protein [bacterium]
MSHGKFATVINCMDGRTQLPANEWMKNEFKVDYVDTITEPGPNKILADDEDVESIKKRVLISVQKHGSKNIAIVSHHDCAGNPVDKETQMKQLELAVKTVDSWGLNVNITGLWVDESWKVERVVFPR